MPIPRRLSTLIVNQENYRDFPLFWVLHPIGRGFGTAFLSDIFSSRVSFRAGFIYGAMSGLFNIAFRLLAKEAVEEVTSPEAKGLLYLLFATAPWIASAATMRGLYAGTKNPMFFMTCPTATTSAVITEVCGYANQDLRNKLI